MTDQNTESQTLGQFIPVQYHYNMLMDRARMTGFRAALDYVVKPGANVLELGGGTGVLSFFAAKHAKHVWCVERNPALVATARRMLALNPNGHKVEVVHADAFDYLPPEPVDVVICEMLHVALLREKQIAVLDAFKKRYVEKFGLPLPRFVPEACIQGVQPVQQNFVYEDYYAATPVFQMPEATQEQTVELAAPAVYQAFEYADALPHHCEWSGFIRIEQAGLLNALRFITKNILAIHIEKGTTVDWHNAYLVLPLEEPCEVNVGDTVAIHFAYVAGAPLEALQPSLIRIRAKQQAAHM